MIIDFDLWILIYYAVRYIIFSSHVLSCFVSCLFFLSRYSWLLCTAANSGKYQRGLCWKIIKINLILPSLLYLTNVIRKRSAIITIILPTLSTVAVAAVSNLVIIRIVIFVFKISLHIYCLSFLNTVHTVSNQL